METVSNGITVTLEDMIRISHFLSKTEHRLLAKELKITEQKVENFEAINRHLQLVDAGIAFQILLEWESNYEKAATKGILKKALASIGRNDVADYVFTKIILTSEEMTTISWMIPRDKQRSLARELKITEEKFQYIEAICRVYQLGDEDIVIEILQEWEMNNGQIATKDLLREALVSIGLRDVADFVFSETPGTLEASYNDENGSTTDAIVSDDITVTLEDMIRISQLIRKIEHRPLAKELKITEQKVENFEVINRERQLDDAEIAFQILLEWESNYEKAATKGILKKALASIGRNDVADYIFTKIILTSEEMTTISWMIPRDKQRSLARELKITEEKFQYIEAICRIYQLGDEDIVIEILQEWEMNNGQIATKDLLREALVSIGLRDVADIVFSETPVTLEASYNDETGSTTDGNVSDVTIDEMITISRMIFKKEIRLLARKLYIHEQKIQNFETNCRIQQHGDDEIVFQILQEWKQMKGIQAEKGILREVLISIGRKDVADIVFPTNFPQNSEEDKMQYKEIQLKIAKGQVKVYKEVGLPQVQWTNNELPLEELYVQLELLKTVVDNEGSKGEPMQLEELFHKINEEEPVRILIEGGPGYGKTTLCCKLLNDWGRNHSYLRSKFKMIFLFELRYFNENNSIEEMLKSECEKIGVNEDDVNKCIKAFENETLLILDGFDELNDEGKVKILPLLKKRIYPSLFVVVTSRRGMFLVEKQRGIREGGVIQRAYEDVNEKHLWNKRVLIKGVTRDKIETFMRKYFNRDFKDLELKINSVIRGEMKEVFECPLFLLLLAMMLEEKKFQNINSKTTLYKEFFNFILRRNLNREKKISAEKEVDIFTKSTEYLELIETLDQFGQLAIEYLCENKLIFEEEVVLNSCKDDIIFHLGFLTKIPKMLGRRKENFYQPIHKSFLEFLAAFSMWNLFKADKSQFKQEIEKVGRKGLKPTKDSLFYVFLGGFMNSEACVLFHCLIRYSLCFNIESLCFTNILLEVQDIDSFFYSFQPILDSFIPSLYSIVGDKGLDEDYFQSQIHSLILKHSSDRQLINVLRWDSKFSFNFSQEICVECIHLNLKNEIFNTCSNEKKPIIKCKNIICEYSQSFEIDKWKGFVSLFDFIQSDKVHFIFKLNKNKFKSHVLPLLHRELNEGQWKQKNIDRLLFHLNEFDDPHSLSLLVDLVRKNKINEGLYLWINKSDRRTEEKTNFLKIETENLLEAVIHSTAISEFFVSNADDNFSPEFNINKITNPHLKSLYFEGSFNSNKEEKEKYSVQEMRVDLSDDKLEFNFFQNIQDMKYLGCSLNCFSALVKTKWPGLKKIEELEIPLIREPRLLNSILQLNNLQVLTLDLSSVLISPMICKLHLINIFTFLHLKICQFLKINNLELFSFFGKILNEGFNNKENYENISKIYSNKCKKFQLQELVISFNKYIDFSKLKECKGLKCIQAMLHEKQLQQFLWVNYLNNVKSDDLEYLFPWNDNFRISHEVDGMNSDSSRQSQFNYRWFSFCDRFCIKLLEE